jgi:hypothetical protein
MNCFFHFPFQSSPDHRSSYIYGRLVFWSRLLCTCTHSTAGVIVYTHIHSVTHFISLTHFNSRVIWTAGEDLFYILVIFYDLFSR